MRRSGSIMFLSCLPVRVHLPVVKAKLACSRSFAVFRRFSGCNLADFPVAHFGKLFSIKEKNISATFKSFLKHS